MFQRLAFIFKVGVSVLPAGALLTVVLEDVIIYNREKDKNSSTAYWFDELLSREPWFKDVVSDVGTF